MEEAVNLDWVGVAGPLMKRYMEATKHPTLEIKHSAIVWRYEEVDPARAKEMVDLMKDLLLHEPVAIKSGHRSIEVHPQGINKGSVVRKVLSAMADDQNRADFVLFIGDDSSDQDMFEFFATDKHKDVVAPRATVITCTVANKASKAKYYLENIDGVKSLLVSLAERARSLSRSKLLTLTEQQ
ncbi:probable alpha,alpha-trehalose-phosphate synthase [UDP-forming] 7 [Musa acuminata AAA Group]|uniref:probable alpha,alpha-trehalose-phosphate synthase [UDP-forming] 7 n=1 Tax=Musa acuminata AAA Group TaxID=214697 RepID=UPI0031DDFA52